MKIINILLAAGFAVVMVKACNLSYVYDVVDSIPSEIRLRIIESDPRMVDPKLLAEYWQEHGDSIVQEISREQEYERWCNEEFAE